MLFYFLLFFVLQFPVIYMGPYLAVPYWLILFFSYWYLRFREGTKKKQIVEFCILAFAWIGGIIFYFLFIQA